MIAKFKVSVEINKPINELFGLFLDKNYFKEWKKDYIGYEHLSQIPGEVGSGTKLIYKRQVMIETIVQKTTPTEIIAEYEHQQGGKTNMFNRVSNRFTSLNDTRTLLEVETEITEVAGFLLKVIIKFMVKAGKKYAQIQLNQLKTFAESRSQGRGS
jgi:hypothetical protein